MSVLGIWSAALFFQEYSCLQSEEDRNERDHKIRADQKSVNFRFRNGSGSLQKIEVATLVCLFDVLHEQLAVATRINLPFRPPCLAAPGKLILADPHIQQTLFDIKFNDIALV